MDLRIMFMNWENENKISVFSKLIYRFKALNRNLNYLFSGVGGGGYNWQAVSKMYIEMQRI